MNNNGKMIMVGLRDFNGQWFLRPAVVYPDPANHLCYDCPVNLHWPDGIHGKIIKVTKNGRYLYQRE